MNKGKIFLRNLLACLLIVSMTVTVKATGLQSQEQELEQERDEIAQEYASLEEKVQQLATSMQQTESEISAKQKEIEQTEEELLQAKLNQNRQYEGMKMRMRYMYENSNVNYIQILLESESIADFINTTEYIAKMSEYDRKKLDEFTRTIEAVEEKELTLKSDYDKLDQLRAGIAAQSAEAEALLAEKEAELSSLDSELSGIRAQIQKAAEEEQKRQEQQDAQNQPSVPSQVEDPVVTGNGQFTHPCPGSYISSTFGEVRNGVNDPNAHKGLDLAAGAGTPIYAADAGRVMYARWSDSAGYWVVIDHGNGLVTKYMHMYTMPFVSEGANVVKGQHIGGVGNTGNSFGNHLHFQVEVYGTPVNPLNYL